MYNLTRVYGNFAALCPSFNQKASRLKRGSSAHGAGRTPLGQWPHDQALVCSSDVPGIFCCQDTRRLSCPASMYIRTRLGFALKRGDVVVKRGMVVVRQCSPGGVLACHGRRDLHAPAPCRPFCPLLVVQPDDQGPWT